jgi:hypothetical protein
LKFVVHTCSLIQHLVVVCRGVKVATICIGGLITKRCIL